MAKEEEKRETRLYCEQECNLFNKYKKWITAESNPDTAYCEFCGSPLLTEWEIADLKLEWLKQQIKNEIEVILTGVPVGFATKIVEHLFDRYNISKI